MPDHSPHGEIAVTLRDGAPATVRPIRPEDAEPLREGFARLSPESRYRRFLSATPRLSEPAVRYLTEVDHRDHEALVAVAPDGTGLGVARYVRSRANPEVAEAAVTVVDDWQGRGVGTALLELLADRARDEGIRRFTALVLASNREMLEMLEDLGSVRVLERSADTVEVELTLVQRGAGQHLRALLRGAAMGRYEILPGPLLSLIGRLRSVAAAPRRPQDGERDRDS